MKKHTYMAIKHLYHTQFKGDILEIIKKQLHNRYLSICLIFAENISQKKVPRKRTQVSFVIYLKSCPGTTGYREIAKNIV